MRCWYVLVCANADRDREHPRWAHSLLSIDPHSHSPEVKKDLAAAWEWPSGACHSGSAGWNYVALNPLGWAIPAAPSNYGGLQSWPHSGIPETHLLIVQYEVRLGHNLWPVVDWDDME